MYDFSGALVGLAIVSAVAGAAAMSLLIYVLPWIWTISKPYIHALTQ